MMKFAEYNKFNLSDINKEVLAKWNAEHLFEAFLMAARS